MALRFFFGTLPLTVYLVLFPIFLSAQDENSLEETLVSLKIPKIGVLELSSFVRGDTLYLPVNELFTFLKIQNVPSPHYDTVSGFFINEQSTYLIDRSSNRVTFNGVGFNLKDGDLLRTESNLYMRSDYFGFIFGLQIQFDFRALTAVLTTDVELPMIRDMKLELMRSNISKLRSEFKPDTIIPRNYPVFHFGMADWSFVTAQQLNGKNNVWLNLNLGALLFGGEANVGLSYTNQQKFTERQQQYLWHYANNDHKVIRQVEAGKIHSSGSVSSLYSPLVGFQFTNAPTTFRRSFGSYTLTDYTEPGWVVELYVNNVLVDYMKADASGFFTFQVPLVYGTSSILLRLYGPMGEERSREKSITIPFYFLPVHQLEYTFTTAMTEDVRSQLFSRGQFNYGMSRRITLGGGVEYLSEQSPQKFIPFVTGSWRVANNVLLSGEYDYGVRFKGLLNCLIARRIQVEANYTKYHSDQRAILTTALEDRRIIMSMPVKGRRFGSLLRLTVDQVIMKRSRNVSTELLASISAFGVSLNLTNTALFYDPVRPYIISTLSAGFRIPGRILLLPQVQYEYLYNRFVFFKLEAERQIARHGFLKVSYDQNFVLNQRSLQFAFRYDLPFAQTGISAIIGDGASSIVESARGSLMFDGARHWAGSSNTTNVGKGGFVVVPFLDMNLNGRRDKDEPKVAGLNIHLTGGRIEYNHRDSSIRVFDLEPFTNYFIEVDRSSFDNIAWQIRNPMISAAVDPNQFKLVEVPVSVYGEASGMVYVKRNDELSGVGRIQVLLMREDSTVMRRTLSEPDGFFNFFGLATGSYLVAIDTVQLKRIRMKVEPDFHPFTIQRLPEGDVAGGLEFILSPLAAGGEVVPAGQPDELNPDAESDHVTMPVQGIAVEAGRYGDVKSAESAMLRLRGMVENPVAVYPEKNYFSVRISEIEDRAEAGRIIGNIAGKGFPQAVIIEK